MMTGLLAHPAVLTATSHSAAVVIATSIKSPCAMTLRILHQSSSQAQIDYARLVADDFTAVERRRATSSGTVSRGSSWHRTSWRTPETGPSLAQ